MLYRTLTILAYLFAVVGIAWLFRVVGKRKSAVPPPFPEPPPEPIAVEAAPNPRVLPAPRPLVEVRETPIPGSELRYYQPFGPGDSIFDVWAKFQAFTSNHPIAIKLTPTDDTTPILTGGFLPDGTLQSSSEMFFLELANAIRANGGPGAWRGVRRLCWFGLPPHTKEGEYHVFTGNLRMELKGVQIMGLTFSVEVTFEPNLGKIPEHFANLTEYFHGEMTGGGDNVVVGFPWSCTGVTLYSQDPSLDSEGSRIAKSIIGKYEKYVLQAQAVVPTRDDANRKVTLITDRVVGIAIHEGVTKGRGFLRIEYGPTPFGPIDEVFAGDDEFVRFSKTVADIGQPRLEAQAALNTPF